MTDIEIINNDTQIRFHKMLWAESEVVLAKCFSFHVDIEQGFITATIAHTLQKALFAFIGAAFKTFNEALHEESRRNIFYERVQAIYGAYNAAACMHAQARLPYYDKMFAHQKDAWNETFYKQNNFLAFSMGLGKTITAASISRIHGLPRTVVFCPSAVKWNWFDDLRKFGFNELYFTMLDAAKRRSFKAFQERFVICNYDVVDRFEDYICATNVDHFIFDEAQRLKNHLSGRSKHVRKIVERFPNSRKTFLSGTPISNRVNDVFNYLKMTDHELGHNHAKFLEEFTIKSSGRGGERVTGGKNLQDLHIKLSNFIIRKTKEECLDLPDKIYLSYKYELDDYRGEYNKIIEEMSNQKSISSLTGNIHSLNIITSKAKKAGIIELAETIVEDGRKVVIFGGYRQPLDDLETHFGARCVKIDGSVDSFMRNELVKKFISDPEVTVFLGNWDAAGVGINLVNASDIIVQNFPLTPDKLWQGIDRLHRIGQVNSVNIHLTFAEGTVDEHLWALLQDKEADINAVIDNGKEVILRENMVELLIKKILNRDDIVFENRFRKAHSEAPGAEIPKEETSSGAGNLVAEAGEPNIFQRRLLQEQGFTEASGERDIEDGKRGSGEVFAGSAEQIPIVEAVNRSELRVPVQGKSDDLRESLRSGIPNSEQISISSSAKYHLMYSEQSDTLFLAPDDHAEKLTGQGCDILESSNDTVYLIMKGRHYQQRRSCSFNEELPASIAAGIIGEDVKDVKTFTIANTFPPPPKFL